MKKATMNELKAAVEYYDDHFRHPALPRLKPLGPYALFPNEDALITDSQMQWDQKWPYSDMPGVYSIFGAGGLLYIGKAWVIGERLGTYFRYAFPRNTDRRCAIVHRIGLDGWSEKPLRVITVAVSKKFEAASLEEYLIDELDPCDNTALRCATSAE